MLQNNRRSSSKNNFRSFKYDWDDKGGLYLFDRDLSKEIPQDEQVIFECKEEDLHINWLIFFFYFMVK